MVNDELRQCPTRIDGSGVLFAHRVSKGQCQDRQRGRYHKCFTCAYNNAYVSAHGMPSPQAAQLPPPTPEPQAAARVG